MMKRTRGTRHHAGVLLAILLAAALFSTAAAQSTVGVCPGFTTQLAVGMQGRVLPGTPNNLRSAPDRAAARLGSIPGDGLFAVLEGPMCSGGLTWWRVSYSGLTGWTAEGTTSERFVQPAGTLGTGGGGAASNTGGSGQRFVPPDVLQGIGTGGMGGGGEGLPPPTDICMTTPTPGGYEYLPTFTRGVNGVALVDYTLATVDYSTTWDITLPLVTLEAGATVRDVQVLHPEQRSFAFGLAPALCVVESGGTAAAFSPQGMQYAPLIKGFGGMTQVQLPPQAYIIPGTWRLQVGDVELNIDVLPPPRLSAPAKWGGNFNSLDPFAVLGGYPPGENIVALGFHGAVLETTANAQGYGVVESDDALFITAIVPQSGENVSFSDDGRISVPDRLQPRYLIPEAISRQIIYDAIWQGRPFDNETWTCPGAMPIRMGGGDRYQVITDSVNVRDIPGVNGAVVGTIRRGESVQIITGVECASDLTWWNVAVLQPDGSFPARYQGWVAEGSGGEYFFDG
ncbi:MAG: SH3 domain-containing protein [bacterium]|nr:SH3 domain-containing protein [bacterium]